MKPKSIPLSSAIKVVRDERDSIANKLMYISSDIEWETAESHADIIVRQIIKKLREICSIYTEAKNNKDRSGK